MNYKLFAQRVAQPRLARVKIVKNEGSMVQR